eukprot:GHVS01105301.1.p1 GENE.GHVS01105301.1~~GHVS01105301.1.p1  ORF type:complete len:434 (+),score=56.58 GHVS01105301.1:24-1325(+)
MIGRRRWSSSVLCCLCFVCPSNLPQFLLSIRSSILCSTLPYLSSIKYRSPLSSSPIYHYSVVSALSVQRWHESYSSSSYSSDSSLLSSSFCSAVSYSTLSMTTNRELVLGTHSGIFHCDEVVGMVLLRYIFPLTDRTILRSRDPLVLSTCDVVIDVGGIYDHETKRYDHHQRGFSETFCDNSRKCVTYLSSAGLVYKHYGKQILQTAFGIRDAKLLSVIYLKLYENFIESVDAVDTGVSICESGGRQYKDTTSLSYRISRLNPTWNDSEGLSEDVQFNKAMDIAREEFQAQVRGLLKVWWPARSIVEASIANRMSVHPSGQIIILEQGCPFIEHLYELEDEFGITDRPVLYALFADKDSWRIRAVGVKGESFAIRAPLPERWRGLRDEEASKAVGTDGVVFVHASGFLAGTSTKEAALVLASKALEEQQKQSD